MTAINKIFIYPILKCKFFQTRSFLTSYLQICSKLINSWLAYLHCDIESRSPNSPYFFSDAQFQIYILCWSTMLNAHNFLLWERVRSRRTRKPEFTQCTYIRIIDNFHQVHGHNGERVTHTHTDKKGVNIYKYYAGDSPN